MLIKTRNADDIKPFVKKLYIPAKDSHKGQNGKVLIIGGSALFHAASIWSAEVASHFVDMVHYASTSENNEVMLSLKKAFRNGIVVPRSEMKAYIEEDDAILIGPGLERTEETKELTRTVLQKYPSKRFVLDAGSLQMMDPHWMEELKEPAIVTPHQKEYEQLFNTSITQCSNEEKAKNVKENAKKFNCVILLKAIVDIVSDGKEMYIVEGGNQGLTKGGTGDVLAGLTVALRTKNDPVASSVLASYILKKTADELSTSRGYWYNNTDIINYIPQTLKKMFI